MNKITIKALNGVGILLFMMMLFLPEVAYAQDIKLIVRGDDFGMTQGSLAAFEKAFNEGVLTCGSLLVAGPWFEGAAELCRKNPQWCVGIHLSLIGEWIGYRWRPVLPWDKIPTLVEEDGFLYTYPQDLFKRNPKIEEIEAELRAQVILAKKKGINLQYIDTHYMGMDDYPGLREVTQKIARDFDLLVSSQVGEKRLKGIYRTPVKQKDEQALKMLAELTPGLWLWVVHIGIDSPEQNSLVHSAPENRFKNGGVGQHRAAELNVVTSQSVKSLINKTGIKLVNYIDFSK